MKPLNQMTPADILDFFKKVDKTTWIKFGIIFIAIIGFFILVVWPAWFKRAAVKNKIQILKGQIALVQTLDKKRPELSRNKAEFQKFIQDAKGRIYKSEETGQLLSRISKLSSQNHVSIVTSQPKTFEGKFPAPFDQLYDANLYDFNVEGGFHDLGKLIASIESSRKLLRIQFLRIKAMEKSITSHSAEISLSAVSTKEAKT